MNAEKVDVGGELRSFKDQTKDLDTALRGHTLSANRFIRTIHNSFSRRMDHLNADLFLENEASTSSPPSTKRRAGSRKSRTGARKKKAETEYGYHFVAYVPKNGSVWELDGLRAKPCRIGLCLNLCGCLGFCDIDC
jgi:ubiquitin carboxyl-terminal hydrolase L5